VATPAAKPAPAVKTATGVEQAAAAAEINLEGLIRDERGVRLAPESED
jgi:hypothetical protein